MFKEMFLALVAGMMLAYGSVQAQFNPVNPNITKFFPAGPANYLTDVTGKVNNPQAVNARLQEIHDKDSLSLAAVVLPTIGDYRASEVALNIGREWKIATKEDIGQANKSTGGIILLIMDKHICRVETARGSEGYITDATAEEMCTNARPLFRAGAFGDGIIQIANEFDRHHLASFSAATAVHTITVPTNSGFPWRWITVIGIFVLIVLWFIWSVWDARREEQEQQERLRKAAADREEYAQHRAEDERDTQIRQQEIDRRAALTPEQRSIEDANNARIMREADEAAARRRQQQEEDDEEDRRRRSASTYISYESYSSPSTSDDSSSSSSSDSGGSSDVGGGSSDFGGGGGDSSW